jgi:hypothetical protein
MYEMNTFHKNLETSQPQSQSTQCVFYSSFITSTQESGPTQLTYITEICNKYHKTNVICDLMNNIQYISRSKPAHYNVNTVYKSVFTGQCQVVVMSFLIGYQM